MRILIQEHEAYEIDELSYEAVINAVENLVKIDWGGCGITLQNAAQIAKENGILFYSDGELVPEGLYC